MPTRLMTTAVMNSEQSHMMLNGSVTVGQLASYLSSIEQHINTSTLEIGQEVSFEQSVAELGAPGGNRLALFLRPPRSSDFGNQSAAGASTLTLHGGSYVAHSRGKHGLLVGKPDPNQGSIPDVDLRHVVPGRGVDYISRQTMWLSYEPSVDQWYAARMGQTRVLLESMELGETRTPIRDGQTLRFYRAMHNPAQDAPLGELTISIDAVDGVETLSQLEAGQTRVQVRLGVERGAQLLQASESLMFDQLVTAFMRHNHLPTSPDMVLYQMKLVAPGTRLAALEMPPRSFLYAAYDAQLSQRTLTLRDMDRVEHVFTLNGSGDGDLYIGARLQPGARVPALHADLYEALEAAGHAPHRYGLRSPFFAILRYDADENTWWAAATDRLEMPVFINTTRLTPNAVPVTSGDVLTIGSSVSAYYVRLGVDIT